MNFRPAALLLIAVLLTLPCFAQLHPNPRDTDEDKLPSGKSQREEILKSEYDKSLKDVAELAKLAEDLKSELEKNDSHVLSVNALKQLDSIEKLTKKIRSRLKRF